MDHKWTAEKHTSAFKVLVLVLLLPISLIDQSALHSDSALDLFTMVKKKTQLCIKYIHTVHVLGIPTLDTGLSLDIKTTTVFYTD